MAHEYIPTTLSDWQRSDQYHNTRLIAPDLALVHARENNAKHGLPDIAVSEAQGKFLHLLVRSLGAERILEVGTLGGYSTIWFAKAVPAGRGLVTTLEISEINAEVARENIAHAGLSERVNIIIGSATETLPTLQPGFDLAFIDADKIGILEYFVEAKRLVRPGGVIIVDNMVQHARVADPSVSIPKVEGARRLLEYLKDDETIDATTVATVGEKSYDGFLYAIRL